MSKPEIENIKNAGVVGAGGAGFPTHVKLDARVDTLIVNAAECEPLIHVDKQLLQHYFEKVLDGMKIASALVGARRVVLALKEKYKKADSHLVKCMIMGTASTYYSMQMCDLEFKELKNFNKNSDDIFDYLSDTISDLILDAICKN